ncbi:hypothetical protein J6590_100551, partial [Homalodisca vitripennis]
MIKTLGIKFIDKVINWYIIVTRAHCLRWACNDLCTGWYQLRATKCSLAMRRLLTDSINNCQLHLAALASYT